MPRKKLAHGEPQDPETLVFEEELEEREEDDRRQNGGLDIYNEDGELLEEGEPTYIEDDPEEED